MQKKISLLGLAVNVVLGIMKIIIGVMSNSSSVIAEAMHSWTDVISSGINYIGVSASKKPADKEHPYGYQKAEVISGFLITVILFLTGLWIVYEAICSYMSPEKIVLGYLTFLVMMFSAAVNEIMARLKIKYGKKYDSISLISDGMHSRVDVWVSLAVLLGLFITKYYVHADAIFAFIIGLYILKESFALGRRATDLLLDTSAGDEIEEMIRSNIKEDKIDVKEIKTQKRGSKISADIKIALPKNLKVDMASKITKRLEEKLIDNIENLDYITIQIISHKIKENYYRGFMGKGIGWGRKGDTVGYCVCTKCTHKVRHKRGIPCSSLKCSKCGSKMERKV